MLFRVLFRLIETKNYFHHYFFLLSAKISPYEDDYSRFLEHIFNLLIFKPVIEIIKFISFCLNIILFILTTLIKANNIVLRFIFIKLVVNILFFFLVHSYKLTYLFIEFVFMFVSAYILSFKYSLKNLIFEFKEVYYDIFCSSKQSDSFGLEITPEEYQEYLDSFEKIPAPDLKVYYPMRFALSSVMIRLTGVILSISFLLIVVFNFTNLFIIIDANFSELRRTLDYKVIEFAQNYKVYYTKYFQSEKYNTLTFYSTIKCVMIIIYTTIKLSFNYLIFDAYIRFGLIEIFKIKYLILNFLYNFLFYIFIIVLPIHFYYVVYHSYKIISISKNIGVIFSFIKLLIKCFFILLRIVLRKVWNFAYLVATVEEPDVHASKVVKETNVNLKNKNEVKK